MSINIGSVQAAQLFLRADREYGNRDGSITQQEFAKLSLSLLNEKQALEAAAQKTKIFGILETPQTAQLLSEAKQIGKAALFTATFAIGGQQTDSNNQALPLNQLGYFGLADVTGDGKIDASEFLGVSLKDGQSGFSSEDFRLLAPEKFATLSLDKTTAEGEKNHTLLTQAATGVTRTGNDPLSQLLAAFGNQGGGLADMFRMMTLLMGGNTGLTPPTLGMGAPNQNSFGNTPGTLPGGLNSFLGLGGIPANNSNPLLGGSNPLLGGSNPLLGGSNPLLGGSNPLAGGIASLMGITGNPMANSALGNPLATGGIPGLTSLGNNNPITSNLFSLLGMSGTPAGGSGIMGGILNGGAGTGFMGLGANGITNGSLLNNVLGGGSVNQPASTPAPQNQQAGIASALSSLLTGNNGNLLGSILNSGTNNAPSPPNGVENIINSFSGNSNSVISQLVGALNQP